MIPQLRLSIVFVDSEPLVGEGAAEAAINGRPETFWRTEMGAKPPRHPHELVIALGGSYSVRGFAIFHVKTVGWMGRWHGSASMSVRMGKIGARR
jgi:hypothetical protein